MQGFIASETIAIQTELDRRTLKGSFSPGAWFGEGVLLVLSRKHAVAVRASRGAQAWCRGRTSERWFPITPAIDVRSPSISWQHPTTREIVSLPSRKGAKGRRDLDFRQLELPFANTRTSSHNRDLDALLSFFKAIPDPVTEQIVRVRPSEQWHLLDFLGRTGEAGLELCQSNLTIAYMAKMAARRNPRGPVASLEDVVKWKQRRILATIGFPDAAAVPRLLRKVEGKDLSVDFCRELWQMMRNPAALASCFHLPRLSRALCSVARRPENLELLEPGVILELGGASCPPDQGTSLVETLDLLRRAQRLGYNGVPRRIHSLHQAGALRASLVATLEGMKGLPASRPLPGAPVQGVPGSVEPIQTVGALDAEGSEMHHCIRTYLAQILQGEMVVYRVLKPERATLALVRRGRKWVLEQVRGVSNRNVGNATIQAIRSWLHSSPGGSTVTFELPDQDDRGPF